VGITPEILQVADYRIAIPMNAGTDSLNVGAASAVFQGGSTAGRAIIKPFEKEHLHYYNIQIQISDFSPAEQTCDALVIFVPEKDPERFESFRMVNKKLKNALTAVIREEHFQGKTGETISYHSGGALEATRVILCGLGKSISARMKSSADPLLPQESRPGTAEPHCIAIPKDRRCYSDRSGRYRRSALTYRFEV
jgi:hypothetical protein